MTLLPVANRPKMDCRICLCLILGMTRPSITIKLIQTVASILEKNDKVVAFHFDDKTRDDTDELLLTNSIAAPFLVFNHQTTLRVERSENVGYFHVVVLDMLILAQYLSNSKNVCPSDIFVIITTDSDRDTLAKLPNLDKLGRVLFVIFRNKEIEVYDFCFYCRVKLTHLTTSESTKLSLKPEYLLPRKFDNFEGYLFEAAYIDYFPYMTCTGKDAKNKTICKEGFGLRYEIAQMLSQRLNFTYRLLDTGRNYENLMHIITAEKIDFFLGILAVTNKRRKITSYTNFPEFEKLVIIFLPQKSQLLFIDILSGETMMVILATFCFLSLLLYFTTHSTLSGSFTTLLQAALEQPFKLTTTLSKSVKILLITWCTFCMTFNVTFRSHLTAAMVRKHPAEVSLDYVLNNYRMVENNEIPRSMVYQILDDKEVHVKRSSIIWKPPCDVDSMLRSGKFYSINTETTFSYDVKVRCSHLYRSVRLAPFRYYNQGPLLTAVPVKYRAPYLRQFDKYISRSVSGGLLMKWRQNALLKRWSFVHPERFLDEETVGIKFQAFYGLFIVYFATMLLCIVCFLGEILCYK